MVDQRQDFFIDWDLLEKEEREMDEWCANWDELEYLWDARD